jgi:hypothetical protein
MSTAMRGVNSRMKSSCTWDLEYSLVRMWAYEDNNESSSRSASYLKMPRTHPSEYRPDALDAGRLPRGV